MHMPLKKAIASITFKETSQVQIIVPTTTFSVSFIVYKRRSWTRLSTIVFKAPLSAFSKFAYCETIGSAPLVWFGIMQVLVPWPRRRCRALQKQNLEYCYKNLYTLPRYYFSSLSSSVTYLIICSSMAQTGFDIVPDSIAIPIRFSRLAVLIRVIAPLITLCAHIIVTFRTFSPNSAESF